MAQSIVDLQLEHASALEELANAHSLKQDQLIAGHDDAVAVLQAAVLVREWACSIVQRLINDPFVATSVCNPTRLTNVTPLERPNNSHRPARRGVLRRNWSNGLRHKRRRTTSCAV